MKSLFRKTWIFFIPLALFGVALFYVRPAAAGSQAQVVYQTPTARPDGRVIYIVQPGDTCLRIQLLTGATIDQMRTLNRLDNNCTISPDQELLLMVVTPVASPTPNPNVTQTPLLPTTTPSRGNGKICVLLYEDVNGDAVREEEETPLAGGAASITDRLGLVSKTVNTSNQIDPICEEVPEGEYNVSMAIPSGYNPTTVMNLSQLKMQAGDQAILEFGAQVSQKVEVAGPQESAVQPQSGENNALLAVFGGILVAAGIALGIYILFTRR